jgi:hypothetical protein
MRSPARKELRILVFLPTLATFGVAEAASQSIWSKGRDVHGTCHVTVGGKSLMDGACGGVGHGSSVFVTAQRDGCSIELIQRPQGVTGKIFAYKDTCGELETEVNLGVFKAEGSCWRTGSARICLQPGRLKNW